jgi:hypothetical protein
MNFQNVRHIKKHIAWLLILQSQSFLIFAFVSQIIKIKFLFKFLNIFGIGFQSAEVVGAKYWGHMKAHTMSEQSRMLIFGHSKNIF